MGTTQHAKLLQHPNAPVRFDPPFEPPGTFFVKFQRMLRSSGQIKHLAGVISHAHALFEGWLERDCLPPTETHIDAAELAVRYCSEPVRKTALDCSTEYAVQSFDALMGQLASCDTTPERRAYLIRKYAAEIGDVRLYHLKNHVGRHKWEEVLAERLEFAMGEDE